MQIEMRQSICPACRAGKLNHVPVLHHMACAYVGPEYDFCDSEGRYECPKCRRGIVPNDDGCEILGMSAQCAACGHEMPVSPGAVAEPQDRVAARR